MPPIIHPIPNAPRLRSAILVILAAGSSYLSGCGSSDRKANSSTQRQVAAVSTRNRAEPQLIRSSDLVLSDAVFRDVSGGTVVVDIGIVPDREALGDETEKLESLLAELTRVNPSADTGSAPTALSSGAGWQHRFHARRGDTADLTIDASGATLERSRSGARRSRAITTVPATLRDALARRTARSLVRRVSPPRRPLDGELIALADLLDSGVVDDASLPRVHSLLIERLNASSSPRRLARAVMPSIARFSSEEIAPLASSTDVVVRLLALLRAAVAGERGALEEILVLSLEYHGDAEHFCAAVAVLLPRTLHSELHRLHPPGSTRVSQLAFLRAARATARTLRFDGAGAWRVEDSP
jgi:hypothetical protein